MPRCWPTLPGLALSQGHRQEPIRAGTPRAVAGAGGRDQDVDERREHDQGLLASFGVVFPKHLRTFEQRTMDAVARAPMLSDVVRPAMGSVGAYDNAMVESFSSTLEA